MKSILITGGAGFIGSNFIPYFLKKYPHYKIINLDLLTYASDLQNLSDVMDNSRYKFIQGDICNIELVNFICHEYDIKGVIHFAAESHVDNSIKNPSVFIKTNVNGTYSLLEVVKKYWMEKPFKYKNGYENCRFHYISTDEVYGSLDNNEVLFSEETQYAPNSPYSASKASANMFVRSYKHTFGLNCVITNCSNNYGFKQHDEKFIPTIIRNAIQGSSIPIYGDGQNIRDWLHVLDHCKGIDLVFHNGKPGEAYNIGGNNEKTNIFIAYKICEFLDILKPKEKSYKNQIIFVQDRLGHDRRYGVDTTKIEQELGWKVEENFEDALLKTVKWYIDKYEKVL